MIYWLIAKSISFGLNIAATLGHAKAKKGVEGRKSTFNYIKQQQIGQKSPFWIHVSSLGEFEQGLPLIKALKLRYSKTPILVTFFSPSGYEKCKDHPLLDFVCYLPFDSSKHARRFLSSVKPKAVFYIKYDLWKYYLAETKRIEIPQFLASATFTKKQWFFNPVLRFPRKMLHYFDHIFVQNKTSKVLLEEIQIKNVTICGDTRVDRVIELSKSEFSFPKIEYFLEGDKAIIFGSTWIEDEHLIRQHILQYPNEKYIIAPHEIAKQNIHRIQKLFPKALLWSELTNQTTANILILDTIGLLSRVYKYGKVTYIGGGLKREIHNTLEPIAFKLPVLFGPRYRKFNEAHFLIENEGGFVVETPEDFSSKLLFLLDNANYTIAADNAYAYIQLNEGATQKIMNALHSAYSFD